MVTVRRTLGPLLFSQWDRRRRQETASISVGDRPSTVQAATKHTRSSQTWGEGIQGSSGSLTEAVQPETVGNHPEVQVSHSCEEGERVSSQLRC